MYSSRAMCSPLARGQVCVILVPHSLGRCLPTGSYLQSNADALSITRMRAMAVNSSMRARSYPWRQTRRHAIEERWLHICSKVASRFVKAICGPQTDSRSYDCAKEYQKCKQHVIVYPPATCNTTESGKTTQHTVTFHDELPDPHHLRETIQLGCRF